jgi:hypothetical protein
MVNKLKNPSDGKGKEDYDWVDDKGKGWRLKKGENLSELKKRAMKSYGK